MMITKINENYEYEVEQVVKVTDGDTYWFKIVLESRDVDYGFRIYETIKKTHTGVFRLLDYDTPETYRPKSEAERELGKLATQFVKDAFTKAERIKIKSYKDSKGKYGRYLAEVFYMVDDIWLHLGKELEINKLLKSDVQEKV